MEELNRKCTLCNEVKPIDDYYVSKWFKSGINTRCKECIKEKSRKYMREIRANKKKEPKIKPVEFNYPTAAEKIKAYFETVDYSNDKVYENSVCRGCWFLGNNCKTCERCIETDPKNK